MGLAHILKLEEVKTSMLLNIQDITNRTSFEKEEMILDYYRKFGIPIEKFLSLMNITMELKPTTQTKSLEKIWLDHMVYNNHINDIRLDPILDNHWDEIIGKEYISEILNEGGAFLTWHYGDYRHNLNPIIKELRNNISNHEKKFSVVVDRDSFNSENLLNGWNDTRRHAGVNLLVSESNLIGVKLHYLLKKKNSFLLFLDGNSGFNEDAYDLETSLVTSKIRVRSGIFRILEQTHKKICVIITSQTPEGKKRIHFHEPFYVENNKIQEACNKTFQIFNKALLDQPELWRLWDRHHNQVISWHRSIEEDKAEMRFDWKTKRDIGSSTLGLDVANAKLYLLEEETASFLTESIGNISAHVQDNKKFRNTTITVNLLLPINLQKVSSVALLQSVLIPSDLQMKLEDLYGGEFNISINRKGNLQVLELKLLFPYNKNYTQFELLDEAFTFLSDVLYSPLRAKGFSAEKVHRGIEVLKNTIHESEASIEYFVQEMCLRAMTSGEPFSIPVYGILEEIKNITTEKLYKVYLDILENSSIHVHVIGNIDEKEKVIKRIFKNLGNNNGKSPNLPQNMTSPQNKLIQVVEKDVQTAQGRLVFGFKTQTNFTSKHYLSLMVFNAIFGNSPNSRLHKKIRSERGLTYFLSSEIEHYKGILLINIALNEEHYEEVINIVNEELQQLKEGEIVKSEVDSAINLIKHYIITGLDMMSTIIDIHLDGEILNYHYDEKEIFNTLDQITVEDIINLANKLKLDTIFKTKSKKEALL